ncbi:MAG: response regulator [Deltaproteobacteria bacterium]|nr:response regulator [Deltaproteobacteria bacterium]
MSSTVPPDRPRVLVVDDEGAICDVVGDFLALEGMQVAKAADGVDALALLSREPFDLVLTDLKMPRMGGLALLEQLAAVAPGTVSVIMTGYGTVETAIDAMKRGAYDYILKPFKLDQVLLVLTRALDKQRMAAENIRLREALSLYRVSEAISASLSLEQVIDTVVASCLNELHADFVSIWLDDGERPLFERVRRQREGLDGRLEQATLDSERVRSRLGGEEPLLAHGPASSCFFALSDGELSSFAAVPLRVGSRSVGFIALASATPGRRIDEGQRKVLSIIAARAAAAIENARLFSDLQETFQQTIEGLARAIDKMDPYTSGHSDRVARYATSLAARLGLAAAEVELVRQSSLMHDIGKIGCRLDLNKPGKLTADEYEAFKRHPVHGREILEPIRFLHPLIPGVHLHHERFDGRGYPCQLAAEAIPVMARIIAVADTYDAMTSDRSYRRRLPHEVAAAEIARCRGTQFDPGVARVFLDGFEAPAHGPL